MPTTRSSSNQIPPYRRVTLLPQPTGGLLATYMWQTYRFLMSDGSTVDVVAVRDDSDLRAAVLEAHFGKAVKDPKDGSIAGSVTLPYAEPEPEPEAPKRRVVRKRGATPVSD
jgi:hypothetical protein